MTTTTLSPEAYIAVGGNRQKIYSQTGGKKVFLDGATEFQLELFNGTTGIVAAKIYINDEPISNSLIVLRPGVREFLDRYIDDNKKFLFDTYTVEDSQAARDAIANNGNVRVEFFRSVVVKPNPFIITTNGNGSGWFNGNPTIHPYLPYQPGTSGVDHNFYCHNLGDGSINASSFTTSNYSSPDLGMACMDSMSFSDNNINEIETGRIEAGSTSNQKFTSYNGEFETVAFMTSEYQILPNSTKPIEISQIRQYCPGCRNRIRKSTWNWCPACGEQLN